MKNIHSTNPNFFNSKYIIKTPEMSIESKKVFKCYRKSYVTIMYIFLPS